MGNFFRELFSAERCILADPFIGHGIYQAFMSQDSAKLQRIDNIITLLEMED